MKMFWPLLFLFLSPMAALSQKAIMLEKKGSLKTLKFFQGETLIYKLKGDRNHWYKEPITEIHVDDKYIEFDHRRIVHLDSILAIREAAGKAARPISMALKGFGLSWTFWFGVSMILGDEFTVTNAAIGVGSYLVGELLELTFIRTHRIKHRKRLRLIDLTFVPETVTN